MSRPSGAWLGGSKNNMSSILDIIKNSPYTINVIAQGLLSLQTLRSLNQSDLARLAGVSRQAVSLWFKDAGAGRIKMSADHLLSLCRGLGISAEDLAADFPALDPGQRTRLEATLLWDRLYPTLEDLGIAACAGEPQALGRLVETYGLYASAGMLGPAVWERFTDYRGYIHPARRPGLERIWRLKTTPEST